MNTETSALAVLLTPAEVAAILYVDRRTVTRWAIAGRIRSIRTPGGHRRFLRTEILDLMNDDKHGVDRERREHAVYVAVDAPSSQVQPGGLPPEDQEGIDAAPPDRVAAAVIARAVAMARLRLSDEAAESVVRTAGAVALAAETVAEAAETARASRAAQAAVAAGATAEKAASAAVAIQIRADTAALTLAEAALRAAALVTADARTGEHPESSLVAQRLALTISAAALVTAQETAAAAVRVATAVAAAAAEVASRVSAVDVAIESEVARAAALLHTLATTTARDVATATDASAREVAAGAFDAATVANSLASAGSAFAPSHTVSSTGRVKPLVTPDGSEDRGR